MRWLHALLMAAGVAFLAGIGLAVLRVQIEFVWGLSVLVAAAVLLIGLRLPDDPRVDAPRLPDPPDYIGSDVSRLAWAINMHTDTANEAVTRRLRATLRRRLQQHGVDVDDPRQASAVDRMLGDGLWARLNGRRTRVVDVRAALAAAERLGVDRRDDAARRDAAQDPDRPSQRESTS